MKNKIFITAFMLMLGLYSYGQFTLEGEIRPRFEFRHGYKSLADSAQDLAAFVEQRTRLNFGYKTEGYIFRVSLQDVHVWGSQPQLISTLAQQNTDGSYLGIHEAWGQALITETWSLKFGRQEIILDDQRIFGNVDWTAQGRSHDAAIIKFTKEKFKAEIGVAYNQDKAAFAKTEASKGSYKAFQYLWLHKDFNDNFGASVLFLNNGQEQLDIDSNSFYNGDPATQYQYYKDNYSQTIGARLTFKKNKLAINGAFYSQIGLQGDRNNALRDYNGEYDKEIAAINYGLDISYKITEKFTTTIGYEFLSGNSETDTSASYKRINHAFNPFYGTNHKFNGHMDYFYVGNHIGSVGLQDIYLSLNYKGEKFSIGADVHLFSTTANVWDEYKYNTDLTLAGDVLTSELTAATSQAQIDAANAKFDAFTETKYTDYTMSAGLGTEIDLNLGFNLSKGVALKAGYSIMLATETLADLKNVKYLPNNLNAGEGRIDQTSSWGWLMLVIKPNFTEKKEQPTVN